MRISILVPDISSNAMARTCPIAKVLSRNHDVEIIGFDPGNGFFEPYRDEFSYTSYEAGGSPLSLFQNVYRAYGQVSGDICYAFRPLIGSLGVGYLQKRLQGTPLILDIEDIVRYKYNNPPLYKRLYHLATSGSPTNGAYTELLELFLDSVNQVTTTSKLLQEQYGGTILPYGPDEEKFNPQTVSPRSDLIDQYKEVFTLGFIGTVRQHKGLSVVAEAIGELNTDVRLVVVGYDPPELIPHLNDLSNGAVDYHGSISHEEVPAFLSTFDAVPIVQRETRYTKAQVPNKLFEAMAMEKPIIASSVGDIPDILGDCGLIIPPDDPDEVKMAIEELLNNNKKMDDLGKRARERYINNYGRAALETSLEKMVHQVT